MLRRARHPLVTILLVLVLTLLAVRRPPPPGRARWIGGTYYAIANSTGFRVVNPDEASADEIVRALVERPGDVAVFEITTGTPPTDHFLWRQPVRPAGLRLETVVDPGWTKDRLDEARGAVIDRVARALAERNPALAEQLRRSPNGERRWHWPSAGWNVVVWGLAVLTVWSLGWAARLWGRVGEARRARRLAIGVCPVCRYPLQWEADRCPECGQRYPPGAQTGGS